MPRTEVWIYIIEPDGTNKIASPSYVAQLLGMCALKDRLQTLEDKVSILEAPMRRKALLDLLKREGGKHTRGWFLRRLSPPIQHGDFHTLVLEKKLETSRSAHHFLYGLPKETTQ